MGVCSVYIFHGDMAFLLDKKVKEINTSNVKTTIDRIVKNMGKDMYANNHKTGVTNTSIRQSKHQCY